MILDAKTPPRRGFSGQVAWPLFLFLLGALAILGATSCGEDSTESTASPAAPEAAAETTPPPDVSVGKFSVVPGAITGYVDSVTPNGESIKLTGWAASSDLARPISAVTGVVGEKKIASSAVSVDRPDVVEAYGNQSLLRSGFELYVPRASLDCADSQGGLEVLGILNREASALEWIEDTSQRLSDAC